MGKGLSWGSAQPNSVVGSNKCNIEPESYSMNCSSLQHVELDWNFNPVKICLVSCLEINDISLCLGSTDVDVESVNNGLSEIFCQSCASQGRQVDTVKILLVPKVNLIELFHV